MDCGADQIWYDTFIATALGDTDKGRGGNREVRMIFFHDTAHKALVVVHGFIKKSQKPPKAELEIALRRMKERSL